MPLACVSRPERPVRSNGLIFTVRSPFCSTNPESESKSATQSSQACVAFTSAAYDISSTTEASARRRGIATKVAAFAAAVSVALLGFGEFFDSRNATLRNWTLRSEMAGLYQEIDLDLQVYARRPQREIPVSGEPCPLYENLKTCPTTQDMIVVWQKRLDSETTKVNEGWRSAKEAVGK